MEVALPQYPTLQVRLVLPALMAGELDATSRSGGVKLRLSKRGLATGEFASSPLLD
jgi:hypothetical protein